MSIVYRITHDQIGIADSPNMKAIRIVVEPESMSFTIFRIRRILMSYGLTMVSLEINTDGEWISYDVDDLTNNESNRGLTASSYLEVANKVKNITKLHQAFYEGLK
jgi:hypothetical protein